MRNGIMMGAAAALAIAAIAGCSSEPGPYKPKRGELLPGTAEFNVDGSEAAGTEAVQCADIDSLTIIETGDDKSGATVMLSNGKKLSVKFVRVRNLNGFNGDYDLGLSGDAAGILTDSTYEITGTAFGYRRESTEPSLTPFEIKVAC